MAKKEYNNYDDTLFGRYIRQIENPDSIGWDAVTRTWRQSIRKGDDKRNRGMGVDVVNNAAARELVQGRPGQYLTESEENYLRNKHLDYLLGVIDRQKTKHPGLNNMSPRKQAEVIGALYRGDANSLWDKNSTLGEALESKNEEEFHKAIDTYYKSIDLGERTRNNDKFWNSNPKNITPSITKQDVVNAAMTVPSAIVEGIGKAADYVNQAAQKYLKPKDNTIRWAEGGYLKGSSWNELSMAERAEIMRLAIQDGVYDLDAIRNGYNEFAKGGSIHIAPSKKGTFTAAAKKHGMGVQQFASRVLAHPENYSPAMRKKANFARNASHWKHGDGGNLYGGGGFASLITVPVLPDVKEIRRRLYNGVNPAGYQHIPERIWDALNNKKANRSIYRDDQWATYLQIPKEERHSGVEKLQPARYRPSVGNTNGDVYRMPLNKEDTDVLIQRAQLSGLGIGKNMVDRSLAHYFGDHTVGKGHDKKGEYISYYDKYDLNPFTGGTPVETGIKSVDKWLQTTTLLPNIDLSMGIGKPFEIYDRIYLDDYYGVPKEARGGNFLPEVTVTGKKRKK